MWRAGGAAVLVAAALLSACATPPPGGKQIVSDARALLDAAAPCCASLAQAARKPLPLTRTELSIDTTAPVFQFSSGKAFFHLYELPAWRGPYAIEVVTRARGAGNDIALFIPRLGLYDADFKPTRAFDEKTLRNRGSNDLERTVFMNPGNAAERYLAIHGSELSASIERPYSTVTYTPIVAGPVVFNMVGGSDGKLVLHSSPVGSLSLEVLGYEPAASAAR